MNSNKVQGFLDELYIRYVLHANITTEQSLKFSAYARSISACPIKAVLFADERGPLIIAFNAEHGLDFEALFAVTGRKLSLDSGGAYKKQLQGFSIRHLPPLGRLYQMPMVIDESLLDYDKFLIEFDGNESFIEVEKKGFKQLIQGAQIKHFTKSNSERRIQKIEEQSSNINQEAKHMQPNTALLNADEIKARFEQGVDLPVMPSVANQLIKMKSEDNFELLDLAHLIESDPVVSAKIISYANSPFFSYEGNLETVQEAVYHVLGVDISLNISLALALGQQFNGPMKGPFGATSIWRHAVYCGVLSQSIATKISGHPGLKAGTAYLFGLLHNIGYLALGHLYKTQFTEFNKAVSQNKDIPLAELEKTILGVTHTNIGSMLTETWGLPEQYTLVVKNHHKSNYRGEYQEYVNIVYIANLLLKRVGIGDGDELEIPRVLLEQYNLNEDELANMLNIVMGWHENLDHLAHQLAA